MDFQAQTFLAAFEQRLRHELAAFVEARRHNVAAGAERALLAALVTEHFGEGLSIALDCAGELLGSANRSLDREVQQYALEIDALEMASTADARSIVQSPHAGRTAD